MGDEDPRVNALEYRVLGPLEVVREGERIPLGGIKQRALVALLVTRANEVVPRDALTERLFGDDTSDSAANALHALVSRVRKTLGARSILTRPPGYVLVADPDTVDLLQFERLVARGHAELAEGRPEEAAETLRAALALWRGTALPDLAAEPSLDAEIRRLEELRLAATMDRIDADLGRGHTGDLVGELEVLIAGHPYQERLRGQLMVALYRAGRQAEALEAYRHARRLLVDELGIEPSHALQELERAILRHAPELEPPAKIERRQPGGIPPRPRRRRRRTVLAAAALVVAAVALAAAVAATRDHAAVKLTPDSVAFVDPRTGLVSATAPTGSPLTTLALYRGSVWAGSDADHLVVQIDARTRRAIRTFGASVAPRALAAGPHGVWALDRRTLVHIDSEHGETESFDVGPGDDASVVVDRATGVWTARNAHATIERLDPETGSRTSSGVVYPGLITSGGRAAVAVGEGALWLSNLTEELSAQPGFLARIDPQTGGATATARLPTPPAALAVADGSVWAAFQAANLVARIDPQTLTITRTIAVGRGPFALAAGAGAVWVANGDGESISRIDPRTNAVTRTIRLGRSPAGIAAGSDAVWVIVS
jgi:YVTN family beta-propeller protein